MSYKIKQYSFDQAKALNVIIKPSVKKNKKLDVYNHSGQYITSIGDSNYKDYPTYLEEKGREYALERRKLYQLRHNGEHLKRGTAGYYAWYILW